MPAIKLKKVTAEYLAQKEKEGKEQAKKEKPEKKNLEDVANEEEEEEEEEVKPYNFLEVQILHDKRKRTIPVQDQKAMEWLDDNIEKKEDVFIPLMLLYEYYTETCQLQGVTVVDIPVFMKFMREKFGKTYGFKDTSPYKGLIKERKVKAKKPHVQGETLALKIKDIIHEVITTAGNPKKGLRFNTLKVGINAKYPALRVDIYPNKLRAALERGLRYGHIELVKGIGLCGYYRLPGESTLEEDKEETKEKKKTKKEGKEGEEKKEGEESTENGADTSETDDSKPGDETGTKRKLEEGEKDEEGEPAKKKQKKKKKKPKKKIEMWGRGEAAKHSDPQKVDDAFPLAITYQSDPKEASVSKIKMYITKHYGEVNPDRLKRALESGMEKGLWENTSGSVAAGTYHLLIDTFNPSRSDTMDDRIAQAIVASHEPKQASALLIKKYMASYHPNLKTEERPHLFKHALERASNKGTIRQLSGLGATGTWMLVDHFYPSPAILAGESEDEDEEWESDDDEKAEKYVPRPTKRDKSRAKAPERPKVDRSAPPPKKKVSKPEPKVKSKPKTPARSAKKSPKSKAVVADLSGSEEEEEEQAYKPRPSKKRGGTPAKAPAKTALAKKTAKKTPKSKEIIVDSSEEEEEQEEDEQEEGEAYRPRPTKKHARGTPAKKAPKSKSGKISDEEFEDDEDVYLPRPTKRGRGSPAKAAPPPSPAKKGKKEEAKSSTPAKVGKSPAKSAKKRRR